MYRLLLVDDHVLFREGLRTLISHWPDIETVGEASNGEEAVQLCRDLRPDIVLMDVGMPVLNGVEATRRIMRENPETRVVMLTISDEGDDLFEAIRAGASGYVLKNTPSRRLHDELRGVLRGEAPLSGVMAAKVLRELNHLQAARTAAPAAAAGVWPADRQAPGGPGAVSAKALTGGEQGAPPAGRPSRSQTGLTGPLARPAQPRSENTRHVDPLTERECQVLQLLIEGLSNLEIADRIGLSENTVKKHLHNILQKLHLNNRVEAAMYAVREGMAER